MKCKEKREAKDVKAVTMKNGKPAQEGVCPVCGTKMFRIGASKATGTGKEPDATAPVKAAATSKAKSATKAKSTAK
jgi:hypothetical protein